MLLLYLSNLHSLTWKMFQVSGNSHTYAKCIHPPPQSAFKMEKHAAVSVLHTPALSLWNTVSHRSSRYRSGNWVTSHTIRYINITGGHWYKKRGGCIRSHFGYFPPCTKHFEQGAQKKSIHAINPGRKTTKKPNQQTEMCYEPSKQDAVGKKQREKNKMVVWDWGGEFITKLWTQKGGETNSVSTSIELLLPPP